MVPAQSLAAQVDRVAQQLVTDFAGSVPDPEVRSLVNEVYGEFSTARVKQFVPVLVDRQVRTRLKGRAQ